MIRQHAGLSVGQFCSLAGIPRSTWYRQRERTLGGSPARGPWPRPVRRKMEAVVHAYALKYPAWGHRKIWALTLARGHEVSMSTVYRIMLERGLVHPARYQAERRELAKARKATFHDPPRRRNRVWQTDFSELETRAGGIWQMGGVVDHPLVSVSFATATDGYGLTTTGELVKSADGGASWQSTALAVPGVTLCFSSRDIGYVADSQGNVYQTTDGGSSWSEDHQQTDIPSGYAPFWSYLACDASSVWQGIRVVSPSLREEGYLVESNAAGSSTWRAVASHNPNIATPGTADVQSLGGLSSFQGKSLIVGIPARGFTIAAGSVSGPGQTPSAAENPPALPASSSLNALTADPAFFLRVIGSSSDGNQSWIYVVDAAVQGISSNYDTLVLTSTDGGRTWSIKNDSGTMYQPQYQ